MAFKSDTFLRFNSISESAQRVLEWCKSLPNVVKDGTVNKGALMKAVTTDLDNSIQIVSDSESGSPSDVEFKNRRTENKKKPNPSSVKNEESVLKFLNSGSPLALQKWTICKKSMDGLELKGILMSAEDETVIAKDFSAGKVLTRRQPYSIKTDRGVFALIGKLQDPNNEIPAEVKKHFSKNFPANWRKIVSNHWNVTKNGPMLNDSSTDSFNKLILDWTDNSEASFRNSREESNLPTQSKKNTQEKCSDSSSRKGLKNNSESLNTKESVKTNSKKNTKKCSDEVLYLKNWFFVKDSEKIVLKGHLYSVSSADTSDELFSAGCIELVKSGKIVTDTGSYILVGNLEAPDGLVPDEVKKQFFNGFPKSWKSIIDEHWNVSNSSSSSFENIKRKGKKRLSDTDISPPSKEPKIDNDEKKFNKNKTAKRSKIPVRKGRKINMNAKKNSEESAVPSSEPLKGKIIKNVKTDVKKINKKNEDNSDIREPVNESESTSPEDFTNQQKKKIDKCENTSKRGKKVARLSIAKVKKKKSFTFSEKRPEAGGKGKGSEKKGKNKVENDKKKGKKKAENDFMMGVDITGFEGQSNKTSDFFKTFDNDCMDNGVALHSFKEVSLGGCFRSAKKKIKGSESGDKETPVDKYVAEVFSHSLTSNRSAQSHSLHSAHSSPDEKRDVVKRIKKLNKGKKTTNKVGKNQNTKSKRCGNSEVNALFKQITNNPSVFSTTPKIVKKVFRRRVLNDDLGEDEDASMVVDSTVNDSDTENDFL